MSLSAGLSGAEIKRRRRLFGANRLRAVREKSPWRILLAQVNSLIVYLLAAAAVLSLAFGEWAEGGAIVAVLAINAAIGFSMELRAVRSMEALRRLAKVQTRVRRNGKAQTIGAEDIVPGDIVLLESGDVVPADIRLAEHTNLRCDESTFTGESVPVAKCLEAVRREAPVPERCNMAFKGTAVTRGAGAGVVVATGMATELGRIADLAERAEAELSPLERRLDRLGGQLVWATLALTALIAVIGVYSGQELIAMIKTAVALAVAAVPEGLPIVTTIALARGMWRMAQRNALIKHLAAIETLGATTVILTDKTGTLTENRMTVARLGLADHDVRFSLDGRAAFSVGGNRMTPQADAALDAALRVGVLCNDASLGDELAAGQGTRATGDPMELALLVAGRAAKLDRALLLRQAPKLREEAFSPETRMMATFHQGKTAYLVAVKGAPEAALQRCTQVLTAGGLRPLDADGRQAWSRRNDAMTADGLRILALAMKETDDLEESPYSALTLLGLVGLHDPPRADVAQAIAACREAGVRVVMLTGDQAGTAQAIAAEIGLAGDATVAIDASELKRLDGIPREQRKRFLEVTIFARVSPETKLDLVSLHQDVGAVVAMTGDGVNDAPALKKADIGIAMGQRGTEVAREVADMVLRDDAFPSIVVAMRYGRVILTNIRKCVVYLMSCNLSEIMVIGVATLSGLPLPLLPLQILYLNLVTDIFPAFALGVGEGDPNVMRRPPSDPKDPILGVERWVMLAVYAALLTAATLGAFWLALTMLDVSTEAAVTISFLTLAAGQIWHVFNLREADAGLFRNEVTGNPFVWIALGICVALIGAAIFVPALSRLLGMTPPDAASWALVLGASLAPVLFGQIAKAILARCGHQPGLKRLMSADRQGQAPERRG